MRPVIKDYLEALTAQPSERMSGSELDRLFAILEGYHEKGLTKEEREHFLNDDVESLLVAIDTFFFTEQQREDLDRIFNAIECMAYRITCEIYRQFGYKLSDKTISCGSNWKVRRSDKRTFSDFVRNIYGEQPETPPKPQRETSKKPKADRESFCDMFLTIHSYKAFGLAKTINDAIDEAPKPKNGRGYNIVIAKAAKQYRDDYINENYLDEDYRAWSNYLKAIYERMGLKPSRYSESEFR